MWRLPLRVCIRHANITRTRNHETRQRTRDTHTHTLTHSVPTFSKISTGISPVSSYRNALGVMYSRVKRRACREQ